MWLTQRHCEVLNMVLLPDFYLEHQTHGVPGRVTATGQRAGQNTTFLSYLFSAFPSKLHRVLEFPLQVLCLHFWQWLYLCGSIPEGCCRQALELHKCFQMHPVKVLLYFPASLMFRNKYWQCLFREFWSISEHVSSMLSLRLRELAILSGDWTVQAWKPNLKKKEEETKALHATPAATTSITGRFFFFAHSD